MNKPLVALALALVAGCGPAERGNEAADGNRASPAAPAAGTGKEAEAAARLTGLYEGGAPGQPNQLCVVEGGGRTRFGIIVWGANMHSCSGAGEAEREGGRLRLRMAGDGTCEIGATIAGGTVTLGTVPPGCAYYCGARARFDGAVFTRKGTAAADAMKATDLVGDPLCER